MNIKKIKNKGIAFVLGSTLSLTGCGTNVEREYNNENDEKTIVSTNDEEIRFENLEELDKYIEKHVDDYLNNNYECKCECCNEKDLVTGTTTPVTTTSATTSSTSVTTITTSSTSVTTTTTTAISPIVTTTTTINSSVDFPSVNVDSNYKGKEFTYKNEYDEYTIKSGDNLIKIAFKLNCPIEDLVMLNPNIINVNNIRLGDKIKYPVKLEYYNLKEDTKLSDAVFYTGCDLDEVLELNKEYTSGDDIVKSGSSILIHKYVGNETSYKTGKGTVNVVLDNRIYGDKFVKCEGFAGSSGKYLVLENSKFEHGVNTVYTYTFDGCDSFNCERIGTNAKDIGIEDEFPVMYFRTYDDYVDLAKEGNWKLEETTYEELEDAFGTNNIAGYDISNLGGNDFITFNGVVLRKSKTLVK